MGIPPFFFSFHNPEFTGVLKAGILTCHDNVVERKWEEFHTQEVMHQLEEAVHLKNWLVSQTRIPYIKTVMKLGICALWTLRQPSRSLSQYCSSQEISPAPPDRTAVTWVRFDGLLAQTCHDVSVGFRSGLCDGHAESFTLFPFWRYAQDQYQQLRYFFEIIPFFMILSIS